jgi:hypothetical protein
MLARKEAHPEKAEKRDPMGETARTLAASGIRPTLNANSPKANLRGAVGGGLQPAGMASEVASSCPRVQP